MICRLPSTRAFRLLALLVCLCATDTTPATSTTGPLTPSNVVKMCLRRVAVFDPRFDASVLDEIAKLTGQDAIDRALKDPSVPPPAPVAAKRSPVARATKAKHKAGDAALQLVRWETRSNATVEQPAEPFAKLEYFEVPLDLAEEFTGHSVPEEVREALTVTKPDGRRYLRWILHPEDVKYAEELEAFLKARGVKAIRASGGLTGYSTASRSLVVVGENGHAFSVKVGLDEAPGNFKKDKGHTAGDAQSAVLLDQYIRKTTEKNPLVHAVVLAEPLAWGLKDRDHSLAMSVRSLSALEKGAGDIYYLPGFSALHDATGRDIAKQNGSENPAEFWQKHYAEPLGRALGELAAKTGVVYDSPHSQNFLVELKKVGDKFIPTGRIVLRDLGDSYLIEAIASRHKKDFSARTFPTKNSGLLPVSVGFIQGGHAPPWLPRDAKRGWDASFFAEFETSFLKSLPPGYKGPIATEMKRAALASNVATAQKNYDIPSFAPYDYDAAENGR